MHGLSIHRHLLDESLCQGYLCSGTSFKQIIFHVVPLFCTNPAWMRWVVIETTETNHQWNSQKKTTVRISSWEQKTAPEKLFQTWHVVIPVVSSLWSWCGAPTRTATHRQDWFALCNFDPNSIQQKSATIGLLKKYWKIKLQRFNERFATCFFFDSNFSFVPANVSIWILQEVTKTLLSKWVITYNTFRGEGGKLSSNWMVYKSWIVKE